MAFCRNCGNQLHDQAVICPQCGVPQQNVGNQGSANDSGSVGWCFLGGCIPLVGLILFLIWKDTQPMNAKQAGKGALISVIAGAVLLVVYFVLIFALVGGAVYVEMM